MVAQCSNCWFGRSRISDSALTCNKTAPNAISNQSIPTQFAWWLEVNATDWCGDYWAASSGDPSLYAGHQIGPTGATGPQGIQGIQGDPGLGFDANVSFSHDYLTSTNNTPHIIYPVHINSNPNYPVYIKTRANFIDNTGLIAGFIDVENIFGNGSGGVFAAGPSNITKVTNLIGTVTYDIVPNVGAGTADITWTGKAGTTLICAFATLVDVNG